MAPMAAAAVVLLVACTLERSGLRGTDGGPDDSGSRMDAGGRPEAGRTDAGSDAGGSDGGGGPRRDAGPDDAATGVDAGPADAGPEPELPGLRVEIPCLEATSDAACTAPDGAQMDTSTLSATAGTVYEVTARFRGVTEHNGYVGGRVEDGWYVGGGPDNPGWNVWRVDVSEPAQHYFLNPGGTGTLYCFALDQTHAFTVAAGASVSLLGDAADGQQVRNIDDTEEPIVVSGVPPAPDAYDGQLVQMDVLSITPR